MKKLFLSLFAALAVFVNPVLAQDADPTASIVNSANTAVTSCINSMVQGAKDASPELRGAILMTAGQTCRSSVIVAQPQPQSDGWATAGRVLLGVAQIYFGYKGQAAMWNGITTLSGQGFATANSIADKGFDAVGKQPEVFITNTSPEGASLLYPQQFGQ